MLQLLRPFSCGQDIYKWVKFEIEIFFRKGQKCAINEKSTILIRFCSKFQEWTPKFSWPPRKIWAQSDQNCGFFINSQILLKIWLLTKNPQFWSDFAKNLWDGHRNFRDHLAKFELNRTKIVDFLLIAYF